MAQQRLALTQEILRQSLSSARATLAEARSAIDDLRALPERADLVGAVQDELRRFHGATGLPCTTDLGALTLLPLAQHEPVVRAVREGLANVARHAQARHVWVRVVPEAEALIIEVQDDGIGFAPTSTTPSVGHYGLLGLRERATLAGGTLEVLSRPGAGTTLRLCLPRQVGEAPR